MRTNDSTVYLTDNGATYCGAHLGHTAKTTGRDLSGQPIQPVTPDMARDMADQGFPIRCETCGKGASILHTAGA